MNIRNIRLMCRCSPTMVKIFQVMDCVVGVLTVTDLPDTHVKQGLVVQKDIWMSSKYFAKEG